MSGLRPRPQADDAVMSITGPQVKAAGLLLGWSQEDLAGETGLSRAPIAHFETERSRPSALSVSAIQRPLEAAGIMFVEGEPGVTRPRLPRAAQCWSPW